MIRYRPIDEPKTSRISKIALPPQLVFIAATYFLPWGFLLLAINAIALGGTYRNREILYAVVPIVIYFLTIPILGFFIREKIMNADQASYIFVVSVGIGLVIAAAAFVSQSHAAELRQYLSSSRS
jgi:hypothetical protein